MAERPFTVLSCCVSLDGFLDDAGPERLMLSATEDLDRVDEVRAGCDAILVGAGTIRRDDPRLLVRDASRRRAREARGQPPNPTKVTVTASGELAGDRAFFAVGEAPKLVYAETDTVHALERRLGSVATVVDAGSPVDLGRLVSDLHTRGVRTLLVEGGARLLTQLLARDLVDELQLVVAPFFVGDPRAPRFLGAGPRTAVDRARLLGVTQVGDGAMLRYALSSRCVAG